MTTTTNTATMIADELEAICTTERLASFATSDTDDLGQHRSLVETRLGGDYDDGAWDDALEILRERYVVTDEQIAALRREAAQAGDDAMVHTCWVALGEREPGTGDQQWPRSQDEARAACIDAINEARAQE